MPEAKIKSEAGIRISRLWRVVYAIVLTFTALLAVETALRIQFPWDYYVWSESPFLTDMIKLDSHQPIYTNPADANSFVYSPGLQYICYSVLKPFGRELDIRWDRAVSTVLGLFGAGWGGLALVRLLRPLVPLARTRPFFFVTWWVVWQVLSKNYMADLTHPDNLHAFHAMLVFWLTLVACETRNFYAGLGALVVAGTGIFTKQTELLSLLGPLAAFAICRTWSWRRWLVLAFAGMATLAVSAWILWGPAAARFWTLQLLSGGQRIWPTKGYWMLQDLLSADRAILLCLGIGALPYLWNAGSTVRRYVMVWACVGFFAVLPNISAYMKDMGMWNNLIIFEIWLILVVWPFFVLLTARHDADEKDAPGAAPDQSLFRRTQTALMLVFLLVMFPVKTPPRASDREFGRRIEEAVRADIGAGHRVLLSHGTAPLIRAGVRDAPLDRCNSMLELTAGNLASQSQTKARIEAHYYDRIYLVLGNWFGADLLECIHQNYKEDYTIPGSSSTERLVCGFGDVMSGSVPVLSPRDTNAPATEPQQKPAEQTPHVKNDPAAR